MSSNFGGILFFVNYKICVLASFQLKAEVVIKRRSRKILISFYFWATYFLLEIIVKLVSLDQILKVFCYFSALDQKKDLMKSELDKEDRTFIARSGQEHETGPCSFPVLVPRRPSLPSLRLPWCESPVSSVCPVLPLIALSCALLPWCSDRPRLSLSLSLLPSELKPKKSVKCNCRCNLITNNDGKIWKSVSHFERLQITPLTTWWKTFLTQHSDAREVCMCLSSHYSTRIQLKTQEDSAQLTITIVLV